MNWYIGQKIVAIRDHSQGFFKKGQEFTIKGVRENRCACYKYVLHIGQESDRMMRIENCRLCNTSEVNIGTARWFAEICFAPIEPKQELSTHTTETLIEELEEQLQTA